MLDELSHLEGTPADSEGQGAMISGSPHQSLEGFGAEAPGPFDGSTRSAHRVGVRE